jgi:high affinity sulfate transporter 1
MPGRRVSVAVDTVRSGARSWLPGLELARSYQLAWLRGDLMAGVVLTAMLVPAGMAYAELAGLPAVTGLYATIVPLVVYAVFGPSRILVLGPDSAVSPLVAATIIPLAASPDERIALAGMLAVLVGGIFVAGGIAKLGFVTDLLSKPIRLGYLAGIAITVIMTQLPKLFGFSGGGDTFREAVPAFFGHLDETNGIALAIGIGCLAVIMILKRFAPVVPGVFVAMAGAMLVTALADLEERGVDVVGSLPEGLPPFAFPSVPAGDLPELFLGALGIAFVAFADTSVLSRSYASRLGQRVDQSQELIALGAANAATGLFQGFPLSSSSSRTPVAEAAGAKTQVTGLVGAGCLALVLLFATGLFSTLPQAALAAVVITAVIGLIDVAGVRRLYRMRRAELVVFLASFAGVLLAGVLWGIAIAIALAVLAFLRRAWWPHEAVLGRADGVKGYHDLTRYPDARQIPGLLLYRFDAPLFFANANVFRQHLLERVAATESPVRWVVVAAEPMTDVDPTAAEVLEDLASDLGEAGIELAFAEMKDPVRDRLEQYGLVERIGRDRFFPTVGSAVHAYVDHTGVDWVDWEDAEEVEPGRPPG